MSNQQRFARLEMLVKLQLRVQSKSIVKIKIYEKLFLRKNTTSLLLKTPEKDFQNNTYSATI